MTVNMKRFVIAGLAAFVFIFIYDMIVHGVLLKGIYEQTADLWRTDEEFSMGMMLVGQLLLGLAIAFFYPIVGPDTECKKAIPFGVGLGLVLAALQLGAYAYMPIPLTLSLSWALAMFLEAIGCAWIVSRVYKAKQ
jgi:hypothetical protein